MAEKLPERLAGSGVDVDISELGEAVAALDWIRLLEDADSSAESLEPDGCYHGNKAFFELLGHGLLWESPRLALGGIPCADDE